MFADGHTASNAPDLFRPPKLSGAGPGQYWGGGPPGKTLGCCQLSFACYILHIACNMSHVTWYMPHSHTCALSSKEPPMPRLLTVAILAQGTSWAVAVTQAFCRAWSIPSSPTLQKKCLHFSICACHPCAGAMLIFSVSFQF